MKILLARPLFLLLLLVAIVAGGVGRGAPAAALSQPAHPRLILTSARLAELKETRTTTRRGFWPDALQSAEDLARAPIPTMRDANNRLRTYGDTLPALGLAFHLTGERRFVDAADRWINAMMAVPEWRGSQNLGRSAWVTGSALIYDWLHDELPAETRARLRDRLAAEGEILLVQTSYWRLLSNHCLIETSALGLIGMTLDGEHPRAATFRQIAQERAALIIEHAPTDGSWGEGVQYWQYGLGYFLRFLEAAKTAGYRDYYPDYAWLKRTGFFPINFSLPGLPAQTVNFGDSGTHDYVAGYLLYLPASAYRNGYFQDYANRTRSARPYKFSWMDFITYDPTVAPIDFTTLPLFHHFEDNGFVIMRSGWGAGETLVAMHCGAGPGQRNQADPRRIERHGFGPGHAHPDTNGFSICAHGEWLALDPGYVHEKWTHDENTLVVNGRGQAGEGHEWLDYMEFQNRTPAPKILRADTNPEFDYVIGDAGNVYVDEAGVRHFRRHLLFLKPSVVVVLDDVATRPDSRIEWLMQASDRAEQAGPDRFEISRNGARLSVQPVLPLKHEARIATRDLRASGTQGKITTFNLAAESAGQTTFLVVLGVLGGPNAPPPQLEWRDGRLTIRHDGRAWTLAVREPDAAADPARKLLDLVQP